jgi:XTP/dITP diphosphohydrolase
MKQHLMIATQNAHKLDEFSQLLPGIKLRSLTEFPTFVMPPETGDTFLDNSIIKSTAVHSDTELIALADDSGLSVDALHGAPGVRSARFAPGSDRDRYLALLAALEGVDHREARFVACLSIVGLPESIDLPPDTFRQSGAVYAFGEVHGKIAYEPRGENGFGYDPIFELSDGRTMAEVSQSEKQMQSHRAIAARKLRSLLLNYFS